MQDFLCEDKCINPKSNDPETVLLSIRTAKRKLFIIKNCSLGDLLNNPYMPELSHDLTNWLMDSVLNFIIMFYLFHNVCMLLLNSSFLLFCFLNR